MSLTLVTAAATDPVALSEAKLHMRIATTVTDDDDSITKLIAGATKYAQDFMRRQFVTATYDLFLDKFSTEILIPLPPTQSITTVKYTDDAGVQQTLASSVYQLDTNTKPARLREAFNQTWPTTRQEMNAVEIRFLAGYGVATTVPESIKTAIKMLVAHWYENAEATIVGPNIKDIPLGVQDLLWADRNF